MRLLITNAALFVVLLPAAWSLSRASGHRLRIIIGTVLGVFCLPAILYSTYYLHVVDDWLWFYQLRSHAIANYYPAALGLFAGWLMPAIAGTARKVMTIVAAAILVAIPFTKPLLLPLNENELHEVWRDGICVQSTPSTCGPASVATILARAFNDPVSERTVARAAHTTATGTEVWYLAQFLRARGYAVTFHTHAPAALPYALAGTQLGAAGHFVAVLGCNGHDCQVADPLTGRIDSGKRFTFNGFYMQITAPA